LGYVVSLPVHLVYPSGKATMGGGHPMSVPFALFIGTALNKNNDHRHTPSYPKLFDNPGCDEISTSREGARYMLGLDSGDIFLGRYEAKTVD
jgi:hypothetical protein